MLTRFKILYVATLGLVLVGWVIVELHYEEKELLLRQDHRREIEESQANFNSESNKRTAEYRRELEQALGGPLLALTKDPSLNIETMLRKTAQACAPKGASVEVHVDRFTEFDIDLIVRASLTKLEMANIAKKFLALCSQYVNSVRFIYQREMLGELDKRAIDQVPNWESISPPAVVASLVQP